MVGRLTGCVLLAFGIFAAGWWVYHTSATRDSLVDRDRDALDDRLEDDLAKRHFPAVHEFGETNGVKEDCPGPLPRPVLYRARPRLANTQPDDSYVAITYVLLYAEDCGALGHAGDNESFTLVLHRQPESGRWQTVMASAVAHRGTEAEQRSVGNGTSIWVSRNKHANFASFDACGDSDVLGNECALDGPPPPHVVFLNAGEPWAPLTNDLGDIVAVMASDRATPSDPLFKLFKGRRIWNHDRFLEAGDITSDLFIDGRMPLPPGLTWDPEPDVATAGAVRPVR